MISFPMWSSRRWTVQPFTTWADDDIWVPSWSHVVQKAWESIGILASFCILALLQLAQGLISAICKIWVPISPKKQESQGEHVPNAANKKSKIKYSKIGEPLWTSFCTFGSPRVFPRCFLKAVEKCAKSVRFLVEGDPGFAHLITLAMIWVRSA